MSDTALPMAEPAGQEPWPASARRTTSGELSVGDVGAGDLLETYGSPLYVLDLGELRTRATNWVASLEENFGPGRAHAYYAGKALLTVGVARLVHEAGMRVDTSTGGELATALAAGVPGQHIALHGNNKSDEELTTAVDHRVGRIVVDSLEEIGRVATVAAAVGRIQPVMVRVTTGVHAGGHDFIATAHEDQKFGLSLLTGQARAAVDEILTNDHLELQGLHSHIGSQIFDLAGFDAAARAILGLRADVARDTGMLMPEVDLGGGYGIRYTDADPIAPTPGEITAALAASVRDSCAELGTDVPHISVEPGRSIAGPAGITLYTVGATKDVTVEAGVRRYVAVDGGMSDNIRPALYQADYAALLAGRHSPETAVTSRVVGKHCESGDIVVHNVGLPADVKRGDILAVPATGAYGRAMSSQYNHIPRPAVVGIDDGQARLMVRRETINDILALDMDRATGGDL